MKKLLLLLPLLFITGCASLNLGTAPRVLLPSQGGTGVSDNPGNEQILIGDGSGKYVVDDIANYAATGQPGAWQEIFTNAITPTSTGSGIFVYASSTFNDSIRVNGNATTTHLAVSGGNSDQWNQAYNWGNHADAGYLTGNQTITLSGDVTGSGETSITATVVDDSHNHVYSNIDETTSSNWASIVSDETGSGAWVFATSPTISEATLNGLSTIADGRVAVLNASSTLVSTFTVSGNTSLQAATGTILTLTSLDGSGGDLKIDVNGRIYEGTDANDGGATAWDDIGNPDANDEIDFGNYTTELNVVDFRIGDGGANFWQWDGAGNASSTADLIVVNATTTGHLAALNGNSDQWNAAYAGIHDAVTLTGQDYLTLSTQEITVGEIEPDDLAGSDFGDFTCDGDTCTLDDDFLLETELDDFSELQAQIADKTLVNEEDAVTWDSINTFSADGRFTAVLHATTTDFDELLVYGNATTTGSMDVVELCFNGADCTSSVASDEVGTLTNGDLCINDGSVVNCTVNTEAELETALDGINVLLETEIDASSELLAIMDDETGTGLLVFNDSPTIANDARFSGVVHATSTDFDTLLVYGDSKLTGNATTTGSFSAGQLLVADTPLNISNWDTAYSHSQDNTQAHSDYLLNSGSDVMAGTLTADGLTLGANENITLGAQTLDHDGTDFVFNDSVQITGNATSSLSVQSAQFCLTGDNCISSWPAGGGDLLADGSVPLTANWDVGNYDITLKSLTGDGTIEGATLTEGGIAVHNNDEMDASSELAAIIDDETGTGAICFATNPTITGATFDGEALFTANGRFNHINASSTLIDTLTFENGTSTNAFEVGACTGSHLDFANDMCVLDDVEIEGSLWVTGLVQATSTLFTSATTSESMYVGDDRIYGDGDRSFTIASSTSSYIGATSTIPIDYNSRAKTVTTLYCETDTGTVTVRCGDGTNDFEYLTCDSDGESLDPPQNNTFTAREKMECEFGNWDSSTNFVTVNINENYD